MEEVTIKQEPEEASVSVPEDFVFVKLTVKEEEINPSGPPNEEAGVASFSHDEQQSETYECKNCKEPFLNIITFKEHLDSNTRQLENGEVVLVCSEKSRLNENKNKCELCHATFKNSHFLNKHKSFHSDEKQFMCTHCLETFKTVSGLKSHLAWRHEMKATYKCKDCMFKCLYPYVLQHHARRCHKTKMMNNHFMNPYDLSRKKY